MKFLTLRPALLLLNVFFGFFVAFSQGNLEGYVYDLDGAKDETLPSAALTLFNSVQSYYAITDIDGMYAFENIPEGVYSIKVNFMSSEVVTNGIQVTNAITNKINLELATLIDPTGGKTPTIVWHKALFSPEDPTLERIGAEIIKNTPARQIVDIVSTTTSVVVDPVSGGLSFRGARPGDAVYYIDGMRTAGQLNIPISAIHDLQVINGGMSARYGETVGGVIVIETKSYFNTFNN